jgi:hypothetical protein
MKKERLYLLDWLKLCTLFAIQLFHTNEFIFFTDNFPLPDSTVAYPPALAFSRLFALGGQILVAVTYLLFGLNGKSRKSLLGIAGFALVGQVILTWVFAEDSFLSAFEWDIYLYIALSNLVIMLRPRASWNLLALSGLCLLLSPPFLSEIIPAHPLSDFLIGRTGETAQGSWPILPWLFLSPFFFQIGALIREGKIRPAHWHRVETFLWPVLFGLSVPFLGHYYSSPIGPRFYEWNFHQSAHLFWTNFLPFVFIMRLSFLERVNKRLSTNALSRFVAGLMWTRYVGICYIVAVIYIGCGSDYSEEFLGNPLVFDLYFISIMPMTELIVRLGLFTWMKLRRTPQTLPGGSSAR